ncbi:MAG TPA: DUF2917 domain-containing protein [Casimicrobiaceae bacterium]
MTAITPPRAAGRAAIPPPAAHAGVYGWTTVPGALVKPVTLERGNVLRILDGRGTQLTPASGVLWITEERSANDTVLLPGDTHRLGNPGTTVVLAYRPGRIVLEVPAGTQVPRRVDIACAEGEPGYAIAFDARARRRMFSTIAAAWRDALAAVRRFWHRGGPPVPTGGWLEHDTVLSTRYRHGGSRGSRAAPGIER